MQKIKSVKSYAMKSTIKKCVLIGILFMFCCHSFTNILFAQEDPKPDLIITDYPVMNR